MLRCAISVAAHHISGMTERASKDTPKSRRTRMRILDAAMRLFADIGYHGASNAVIAEAAGLTRGAMLYHFPTREALVEDAIDHIQAARLTLFDTAAGEPPPGGDATAHPIDAYLRLLAEPPFVAFADLHAAARIDPQARAPIAVAEPPLQHLP